VLSNPVPGAGRPGARLDLAASKRRAAA
jgi:hypothetical protein